MPVYRIIPGDATATGTAALDDSFGSGGLSVVSGVGNTGSGLGLQSDGRIVAVGSSSSIGGGEPVVVRLLPTGAVDSGYGSATGVHVQIPAATDGAARAVALLPSGGVAVGGMTVVGGSPQPFVARVDADGNPDTSIGPGGARLLSPDDTRLDGLAVQPDGRIVTAGTTGGPAGVVYRLLGEATPPKAATCVGRTATLAGTGGADALMGTPAHDVIVGLGGDDTISGLGDGDIVCGGAGADHIAAGRGAEVLDGQAGRDSVSGGRGRDHLSGGRGRDRLGGGAGPDLLQGGARRDRLFGGPGRDGIRGGRGPDLLSGGRRADTLSGGRGGDHLQGGHGKDMLMGGPGRDVLQQ
jgi:Ca2+-binding RTX toxin-like protein